MKSLRGLQAGSVLQIAARPYRDVRRCRRLFAAVRIELYVLAGAYRRAAEDPERNRATSPRRSNLARAMCDASVSAPRASGIIIEL